MNVPATLRRRRSQRLERTRCDQRCQSELLRNWQASNRVKPGATARIGGDRSTEGGTHQQSPLDATIQIRSSASAMNHDADMTASAAKERIAVACLRSWWRLTCLANRRAAPTANKKRSRVPARPVERRVRPHATPTARSTQDASRRMAHVLSHCTRSDADTSDGEQGAPPWLGSASDQGHDSSAWPQNRALAEQCQRPATPQNAARSADGSQVGTRLTIRRHTRTRMCRCRMLTKRGTCMCRMVWPNVTS